MTSTSFYTWCPTTPRLTILCLILSIGVFAVAEGQERGPDGRARNPGLPKWCETPVADRKSERGCYTTALTELGVPPREPLYWHLHTFATRAAAEAERSPHGTVVEGHGKHWLFTIAEQSSRLGQGDRAATIGPLIVDSGVAYTARYLETVIEPGFQEVGRDRGHRHPGPEAWFLVSGGQCLETSNGVMTGRAGESMLVPDGWRMSISGLGTELRRTVVLVLHRSNEPYVQAVNVTPDAPRAQEIDRPRRASGARRTNSLRRGRLDVRRSPRALSLAGDLDARPHDAPPTPSRRLQTAVGDSDRSTVQRVRT